MEQTCSVQMTHRGKSTHITCPSTAKYEDFIQIAMERFSIPIEFKDFIRLYSGHSFIFAKNAFDTYLMHHPNPKMVFEIRVAYLEIVDKLHLYGRTPTDPVTRNLKLPRDDSVPGNLEDSDVGQTKVKRMRIDFSKGSEFMEF